MFITNNRTSFHLSWKSGKIWWNIKKSQNIMKIIAELSRKSKNEAKAEELRAGVQVLEKTKSSDFRGIFFIVSIFFVKYVIS